MFTLCIKKTETGVYGFTIVKPDTCYVSGERKTKQEVYEELDRQIEKCEGYSELNAFDPLYPNGS